MKPILPVLCALTVLADARGAGAQGGTLPDSSCARAIHAASLQDALDDFARTARLLDAHPGPSALLRRTSAVQSASLCVRPGAAPWGVLPGGERAVQGLRLLPAQLRLVENSAYPTGGNDGPLWQGKGASAGLQVGAAFRWRGFSAALAPELTYSQNADFLYSPSNARGLSPYAYPWHPGLIDWPERFGPGAFTQAWPGQSYLRFDAGGLGVGASTENLWWGPARFNPILMSNTAPGFPHVFLETDRPLDIHVGWVQGQAIWGRLRESSYYFTAQPPAGTFMAGLGLTFTPKLFPDLTLGGARSYLRTIPPGGITLSDFVDPYLHPGSNPTDTLSANNQLLSLFAHFSPAGSGFEGYAELAREDNWSSFQDLLMEPDHSQGYTLGFQQVVARGARWWRLYGELTHLNTSTTVLSGRTIVTFYVHTLVLAGYTNRGQLLGASIGPGSQSEILGLDLFHHLGSTGVFLQRIRHDDDAYYAGFAPRYDFRGHDLEVTGGLRQTVLVGRAALSAELSTAQRRNRDFLGLDGVHEPSVVERNWRLLLDGSWTP